MWKENYDSYFLLFPDDENKLLINKRDGRIVNRIKCLPHEVKDWGEIDIEYIKNGTYN